MSLATEIEVLQDVAPIVQVNYISIAGVTTDISAYYVSGGTISKTKEKAPDEIDAGDFDVVLHNHDNYFSEYVATSLFYGVQYHGAKIQIKAGVRESDGTQTYVSIAYGYIDELIAHDSESKVTLRCRDLMRDVFDSTLHLRPLAEVPVADAGNTGDGECTVIETKPFSTVNEDWTLTCTLGGGDGTATFSVVGTVSGDVGDATSGTQFSSATGGVRFTLSVGTAAWVIGDKFTFSTKQHPEWTTTNPAKIIWEVLTGYDYDTDTQQAWSTSVLALDHTQGAGNTQVNFASFQTAVSQLSSYQLTGYSDYEETLAEFVQELLLMFLGSLYVDSDGKIAIKTWQPVFGSATFRHFMDTKKITVLGYNRSVNEIINYIRVSFKLTNTWEWSDEELNTDGYYISSSAASIAKYGKLAEEYSVSWYSASKNHVEDFAEKLIDRYKDPPLVVDLTTGIDGLQTELGDRIYLTDTKYGLSGIWAEVTGVEKQFDELPVKIKLTAKREPDVDIAWAFLGSSANESDGMSPQSGSWDTATETDKQFAYLSQTATGGPDYRMF